MCLNAHMFERFDPSYRNQIELEAFGAGLPSLYRGPDRPVAEAVVDTAAMLAVICAVAAISTMLASPWVSIALVAISLLPAARSALGGCEGILRNVLAIFGRRKRAIAHTPVRRAEPVTLAPETDESEGTEREEAPATPSTPAVRQSLQPAHGATPFDPLTANSIAAARKAAQRSPPVREEASTAPAPAPAPTTVELHFRPEAAPAPEPAATAPDTSPFVDPIEVDAPVALEAYAPLEFASPVASVDLGGEDQYEAPSVDVLESSALEVQEAVEVHEVEEVLEPLRADGVDEDVAQVVELSAQRQREIAAERQRLLWHTNELLALLKQTATALAEEDDTREFRKRYTLVREAERRASRAARLERERLAASTDRMLKLLEVTSAAIKVKDEQRERDVALALLREREAAAEKERLGASTAALLQQLREASAALANADATREQEAREQAIAYAKAVEAAAEADRLSLSAAMLIEHYQRTAAALSKADITRERALEERLAREAAELAALREQEAALEGERLSLSTSILLAHFEHAAAELAKADALRDAEREREALVAMKRAARVAADKASEKKRLERETLVMLVQYKRAAGALAQADATRLREREEQLARAVAEAAARREQEAAEEQERLTAATADMLDMYMRASKELAEADAARGLELKKKLALEAALLVAQRELEISTEQKRLSEYTAGLLTHFKDASRALAQADAAREREMAEQWEQAVAELEQRRSEERAVEEERLAKSTADLMAILRQKSNDIADADEIREIRIKARELARREAHEAFAEEMRLLSSKDELLVQLQESMRALADADARREEQMVRQDDYEDVPVFATYDDEDHYDLEDEEEEEEEEVAAEANAMEEVVAPTRPSSPGRGRSPLPGRRISGRIDVVREAPAASAAAAAAARGFESSRSPSPKFKFQRIQDHGVGRNWRNSRSGSPDRNSSPGRGTTRPSSPGRSPARPGSPARPVPLNGNGQAGQQWPGAGQPSLAIGSQGSQLAAYPWSEFNGNSNGHDHAEDDDGLGSPRRSRSPAGARGENGNGAFSDASPSEGSVATAARPGSPRPHRARSVSPARHQETELNDILDDMSYKRLLRITKDLGLSDGSRRNNTRRRLVSVLKKYEQEQPGSVEAWNASAANKQPGNRIFRAGAGFG
ncbi:unnamed protein product [Pedinophyceae sp. YPF-701]|nr:unnamed protein product [Pedinophyceae sp. YPF-701]